MNDDSAHVVIDCNGEISLSVAEDLHDRLCAALTDGRPIEIDCTGATSIDISFIQLLVAARASAARRGVPLALKAPGGEALQDGLRRGGFLPAQPFANDDFWIGGI
ncbi:MAG: STAS domain-containing protein [Telmatospirillum sp.]|nr:STAS domain-containing protein [Telmatospirillum sp.]